MREAFAKFSKDPEVKEEAKKVLMTVEYVSADDCVKVCDYLLNQPENILSEFRKYIKF